MVLYYKFTHWPGLAAFCAFVACVPSANWLISNVGTTCIPDGPCLIPVGPGLYAPSGVLLIGLAFVLRDLVQFQIGVAASVTAILIGTVLSSTFAPEGLVLASASAFLIAELADLTVYTPLQRKKFWLAVIASGIVGSVIDSALFVWLAFGKLTYFSGQFVGKMIMVAAAAPILILLRRHYYSKQVAGQRTP